MKRLLALLFLIPLLAHAQKRLDEQWYTLLLEGTTVGFLHQSTWQLPDGQVRSEIEQNMQIRRFGVPFSVTQKEVWIEDPDGVLVSVRSQLDTNGRRQETEVRALEGGLQVRLRRGGEAGDAAEGEELLLPVDGELRGMYAVDREITAAIAGWGGRGEQDAGQGSLQYEIFSTESLEIEEVRLRILGPGELEDSLGDTHRGLMVEERFSLLPGVVTTRIYDERAVLLYSKTPVGLALEVLRMEGNPGGSGEERAGEGRAGGEPQRSGRDGRLPAAFDVASLIVPVRGVREVPLERAAAVTVLFRGQGIQTLREAVSACLEDLGSTGGGFPAGRDAPVRIVTCAPEDGGSPDRLVLELKYSAFATGVAPDPQ
ncbi:MAG: hypothetical protein JXB06_00800, partial [Spirochaetales bacterium]|nr:hypothetical protein [Spirochaetales bacterium]